MGNSRNTGTMDQLVVAFQSMECLPKQLASAMEDYVESFQQELNRHDTQCRNNEQELNQKKQQLSQQRSEMIALAERARDTVLKQIQELDQQMEEEYSLYRKEMSSVPINRRTGEPTMSGPLGNLLRKVMSRQESSLKQYNEIKRMLTQQEQENYRSSKEEAEELYRTLLNQVLREYNDLSEREKKRHDARISEIKDTFRDTVERYEPNQQWERFERIREEMPKQKSFECAQVIPGAVGIGYARLDMEEWLTDSRCREEAEYICDRFHFALSDKDASVLEFPVGRSFRDARFNKLIVHEDARREQALEYLRALEMRLFMSVPGGKLRVTMFDPVDTSSNFSMFSNLGDDDDRIISSRIRSDAKEMKEQLSLLISQIEHVHQDCLRDEYEDIVLYNQHVGKNAEPLQALFVADFPRHFDRESCELLEKVISSGPRCGIYTFMTASASDLEHFDEAVMIASTLDSMERIVFSNEVSEEVRIGDKEEGLRMRPIILPDRDERSAIFEVLRAAIKNADRIVIKYDEVSDNLTQHEERWFQYSCEDGLDIPIGLEGASRNVQVHLGGRLVTQHHALISGTIGAGKSTLLHTVILSTLLRYGPEDVQIFLLDFKRGVEANLYAASGLAHFRVISLDTEPEFGLAVLQYLDEEQAERAQCFHEEDCAGIESYNQLVEESGTGEKMPRILLIVDEFHEMFPRTDSWIANEIETKLEQVVRQGRALGIHVILASQTLPGGDLVEKVYSQIMNRIALNSTAEAAQLILSSDNEAVNTLVNVDTGKGIFNDGGGNRDSNHLFRAAFFSRDETIELLARIRRRQDEVYPDLEVDKPRLLLTSIQDDPDNPLNLYVTQGKLQPIRELGCPLYLGEEISLENNFRVKLTSRRAQNLLIVGRDYQRASQICSFAAFSVLMNAAAQSGDSRLPDGPVITFFDFSRTRLSVRRGSRSTVETMNELSARLPHAIRVFGRDSLMDGISTLEREIGEKAFQRRHVVIFMGLNRARRLLDHSNAYQIPPLETFKNLLKNGPEAGVHFVIWANEPGSFCTYYSDVIPEFDYRLVYDLEKEEYQLLIQDASMDTQSPNNVLAYHPDDDNKKVRVYSAPLKGWFHQLLNRLDPEEDAMPEEDDFFEFEEEFEDDE